MRKIATFLFILTSSTFCYAQYVSQITQQRFDDDERAIARDNADMQNRLADEKSIINDNSAYAVTNVIPAVQVIINAEESAQAEEIANQVISQPESQGTISSGQLSYEYDSHYEPIHEEIVCRRDNDGTNGETCEGHPQGEVST